MSGKTSLWGPDTFPIADSLNFKPSGVNRNSALASVADWKAGATVLVRKAGTRGSTMGRIHE